MKSLGGGPVLDVSAKLDPPSLTQISSPCQPVCNGCGACLSLAPRNSLASIAGPLYCSYHML